MSVFPEIRGAVVEIHEPWTSPDGCFKKRELVVDTSAPGSPRPCPICVVFRREKTALLADLEIGDRVAVSYTLEGREWNGRYYTDVVGMALERECLPF